MDLKRVWRNGFLVSMIFALPLSDLYYFQHDNINVNGSSRNKPVQRAQWAQWEKNCVPDNDCADSQNGSIGSGLRVDNNDFERNGLSIAGTSSSGLLLASNLASNNGESGSIGDAALHFSPDEILQSVDLNGEENPDIANDINPFIDTDFRSIAALSFGFGGSTSYNPPGYSGLFAPVGFAGGGSAASTNGSQNAFNNVNETAPSDPFAESSTQTEITVPEDTLQNVPEPSPFVLMAIGTISVASLLHLRKSKTPAIRS